MTGHGEGQHHEGGPAAVIVPPVDTLEVPSTSLRHLAGAYLPGKSSLRPIVQPEQLSRRATQVTQSVVDASEAPAAPGQATIRVNRGPTLTSVVKSQVEEVGLRESAPPIAGAPALEGVGPGAAAR